MKTVVVDIDNTLWDFGSVLYKYLENNGYSVKYSIPEPNKWDWLFYHKYGISTKDFYKIVYNIHSRQEEFSPYPCAKDFLESLKQNGFRIVIASNRSIDHYQTTKNWFDKNSLLYDAIDLRFDKRNFLDANANIIDIVVDDSPIVLSHCNRLGIKSTGLLFSWNKELQSIVPLWNNLIEVKNYIVNLKEHQS